MTAKGTIIRTKVSIVIPAWNEGQWIGRTLLALQNGKGGDGWWDELIVVDDGSTDDTYKQAVAWADKVIVHQMNKGKGAALMSGCLAAHHPIIVLLDADLGETAIHGEVLVKPILAGEADMTIARLPAPITKGGFGLVKSLAVAGVYMLSGYKTKVPLSGQRALRKPLITDLKRLPTGFGVEVGMTIDMIRKGYKIKEVDADFRHRETGRSWIGFKHRGKQFLSVCHALLDRWLNPTT